MPAARRILLDDRLLIEELLVGLRGTTPATLCTTSLWYYRACRAAMAGAGGHLSGPFASLDVAHQERAILSLLRLRDDIELPDSRIVVPAMAEIAQRHPRLNVLNLEAVAVASTSGATVWLSNETAAGVLSEVLDAEQIRWRPVTLG